MNVIFFALVLVLISFIQPVSASGQLSVSCDDSLAHKSVKGQHRMCPQVGRALPGDIVVLKGQWEIGSTRQSPVNYAQQATLTGPQTIKTRVYSVQPSSPSYSVTSDGSFTANIVVPLELPPGTYTIALGVQQHSCRFALGAKSCPREDLHARLEVEPTAGATSIALWCPDGNPLCVSSKSYYRLEAERLRAIKGAPVFVYVNNGSTITSFSRPVVTKEHDFREEGLLQLPPGTYQLMLRSKPQGMKLSPTTDWQIDGHTFTVLAPPKPAPSKEGSILIPAPQPVPPEKTKPVPPPQKEYRPSMTVQSLIHQGGEMTMRIANARPGQKLNRVYFGDGNRYDQYVEFPLVTVGDDGATQITVVVPERADLAIPPQPLYWKEGVTARILVSPAFNDESGLHFMLFPGESSWSVGTFTKIPVLCPLSESPTLQTYEDRSKTKMRWQDTATSVYDQRLTSPEISFSGKNFTCYDNLTAHVSGIRVNGKARTSVHTTKKGDFFTYWSGILETDRFGRFAGEGKFALSNAASRMDPDVTQLTLTVSDQHGKTARLPIKVISPLHDYGIRVKEYDTDPSSGVQLVWKGFSLSPKTQLTMENSKLLPKKSLVLGNFNLDAEERDEEGNSIVTFRIPDAVLPGDYTLRMKQGDAYATTLFTLKRPQQSPGSSQKKSDKKKHTQQTPEISKKEKPCTGLSGYMLRQCTIAYDLLDPLKEEQKQEEKVIAVLCQGLEGYMLAQCRSAYGISETLPKEQKKQKKTESDTRKDLPPSNIPCSDLSGYMLKSCQEAYGLNMPGEEKKHEEVRLPDASSDICRGLEDYMLRQCEHAYGVPKKEDRKPEEAQREEAKRAPETPAFVVPDIPSSPVKQEEKQPSSCQPGFTYSPTFGRCIEDIPSVQEEARLTCPAGETYSITLRQCLR